jgi:wyosine [tRNA(Phe)-imidazoG37] synthetase (radical SAM superfamily)
LGRSLGIDLLCSEEKICSFDCIYCQLGETKIKTMKRDVYVESERIFSEWERIEGKFEADVITLSGTGEPTLGKNLGEVIDFLRKRTNLPLAILTNSSLLGDEEVREELNKLDIVVAKLDACDEESFREINRPVEEMGWEEYFEGIKEFRRGYRGKFALQMMFIEENRDLVEEMVRLARELEPDEVQVNTPLRPCGVRPLGKEELEEIKGRFTRGNAQSPEGDYPAFGGLTMTYSSTVIASDSEAISWRLPRLSFGKLRNEKKV